MAGDPAEPRNDADQGDAFFWKSVAKVINELEETPGYMSAYTVLRELATRLQHREAVLQRSDNIIISQGERIKAAEGVLKHIADQRLSGAARDHWEGEFGEDAEPDFEGGYDSIIQKARRYFEESK